MPDRRRTGGSPGARGGRARGGRAARGALAAAVVALAACSDGETAIMRGDRLWADSQFTTALAEYRLAISQSGGSEAALLRAAHAFARTGEFDRARQTYDELLEWAPAHTDQAVYDYLMLARRARAGSDLYDMARAVEAALALRPALLLADLNLPLARYYIDTGNNVRALAFYERALGHVPPDSTSELLYIVGELHEQAGECSKALDYFRAYRRRARRGRHATEAAWHQGNCAIRLARAAQAAGHVDAAMRHLGTVVDLGVPENVQDEAWFRRGEVLYTLGRYDDAMAAYREVLRLNPQRTGRLVEGAQERIDDIRFGRVPANPYDRVMPLDIPFPDTVIPFDTFPDSPADGGLRRR